MMGLGPTPTAAYVRPLARSGVTGGAWSAGAYLAFSCRKLYLHPGTVIGAASPVTDTPEGPRPVEEKYISAVREKFRARAEQNGYPANLAVAMVDKDLEVFEVSAEGRKRYLTAGEIERLKGEGKKLDVPAVPYVAKGKLLTLTDRQVAETGMGKIAPDRKTIYEDFGLPLPVEKAIEPNWSETLVSILTSPVVSMILLAIGILGVWVELKTPGFGLPGIAGILAFALLLFGQHLVGLAEVPELLLLAAGAALVAVELFLLPGAGAFAVLGVACLLLGLVLSLQGFVIPDPQGAPWEVDLLLSSAGRVLLSFVAAGLGVLGILHFLPKVPVLNRLVHATALSGQAPAAQAGPELVGAAGRALTPLRPGGKIDVQGRVLDVRIEGMRIVVAGTKH
jgi:membrane-bound serine protease (ClpP class)